MIRFFWWLFGYVEFVFENGFAEGFINDCYNKRLGIKHLDKRDNTLVGEASAKSYKRLHTIALKNGGKVKITKKHGPIFLFLKIQNRWGIFAGCLVFVFIVNFLSGFVWNIEITGNSKISDAQIMQVLKDNGFGVGVHWSAFNKENVENYILATFDNCAWAHINRFGTTARVEINEAVMKPEIINDDGITNLKATKDGIIVKATVFGGWQVAQVGDSVVQGDLLVSGVYESEATKQNLFAHAHGEFIAQVKEGVVVTVSRTQSERIFQTPRQYKTLVFFGIKLPLHVGNSNQQNSLVETTENYLTISEKSLPIGVVTKTVTPYTVSETLLNDKELNALVQKEIDKKLTQEFSHCEILSKNVDISLNQHQAVAKIDMVCLENIGEIVNITKNS